MTGHTITEETTEVVENFGMSLVRIYVTHHCLCGAVFTASSPVDRQAISAEGHAAVMAGIGKAEGEVAQRFIEHVQAHTGDDPA